MDDDLTAALKAAQAAPARHYLLCAETPSDGGGAPYPLETVRLPLTGVDPVMAAERLRAQAKARMQSLGFDPAQIDAATIVLGLLPEDVTTLLDPLVEAMRAGGSDLALLDLPSWEAAKLQLNQAPTPLPGGDEELTYKGLRLRPSSTH